MSKTLQKPIFPALVMSDFQIVDMEINHMIWGSHDQLKLVLVWTEAKLKTFFTKNLIKIKLLDIDGGFHGGFHSFHGGC